MSQKADKTSPKVKRRRVTFILKQPQAGEVRLLGDFNQWNPKKHPMRREKDGAWKKIVMIPPGRYEYRFQVDGQWASDPKNSEVVRNCFGTFNNVITVTPR